MTPTRQGAVTFSGAKPWQPPALCGHMGSWRSRPAESPSLVANQWPVRCRAAPLAGGLGVQASKRPSYGSTNAR